MTEWLALAVLVPAVVAPTVLLFGFAGCHVVFGLTGVSPTPDGPVLGVGDITTDSITLTWSHDSAAESVEFTRNGVPNSFDATESDASVVDFGLDPNTEYRYTAKYKYSDNSYSKDSAEVTVKTSDTTVVVRPMFDALAVRSADNGPTPASTTWTHAVATTSSPVAVVVAVRWKHTGSGGATANCTATYGGANMSSTGAIGLGMSVLSDPTGEYQQLFTLANAPIGSSQVRVTVTRNFTASITIEGCSISYSQAAGFGPAVPSVNGAGAGTTMTHTVASSDNETVVQMFGTTTGAIGNYSQTARLNASTDENFVVGDANGNVAVPFAATRVDGAGYASSSVRVTPP